MHFLPLDDETHPGLMLDLHDASSCGALVSGKSRGVWARGVGEKGWLVSALKGAGARQVTRQDKQEAEKPTTTHFSMQPQCTDKTKTKQKTHVLARLGRADALEARHRLVVEQRRLADRAAVLDLRDGHVADAVGNGGQDLRGLLGVGDLGAAVVKLDDELCVFVLFCLVCRGCWEAGEWVCCLYVAGAREWRFSFMYVPRVPCMRVQRRQPACDGFLLLLQHQQQQFCASTAGGG